MLLRKKHPLPIQDATATAAAANIQVHLEGRASTSLVPTASFRPMAREGEAALSFIGHRAEYGGVPNWRTQYV